MNVKIQTPNSVDPLDIKRSGTGPRLSPLNQSQVRRFAGSNSLQLPTQRAGRHILSLTLTSSRMQITLILLILPCFFNVLLASPLPPKNFEGCTPNEEKV